MSEHVLHPADERHEQRDVHRRTLLIFALCFAAFIVVAVSLLWLTFGRNAGGFAAAEPRTDLPANGEIGQRRQLANYLGAQRRYLDTLEWTDASHSHAKVPIDDAMRLLAAKGAGRIEAKGAPQ